MNNNEKSCGLRAYISDLIKPFGGDKYVNALEVTPIMLTIEIETDVGNHVQVNLPIDQSEFIDVFGGVEGTIDAGSFGRFMVYGEVIYTESCHCPHWHPNNEPISFVFDKKVIEFVKGFAKDVKSCKNSLRHCFTQYAHIVELNGVVYLVVTTGWYISLLKLANADDVPVRLWGASIPVEFFVNLAKIKTNNPYTVNFCYDGFTTRDDDYVSCSHGDVVIESEIGSEKSQLPKAFKDLIKDHKIAHRGIDPLAIYNFVSKAHYLNKNKVTEFYFDDTGIIIKSSVEREAITASCDYADKYVLAFNGGYLKTLLSPYKKLGIGSVNISSDPTQNTIKFTDSDNKYVFLLSKIIV